MARSMKVLGVACAFGLSAVRGSPDDSAALVQTSIRGHVSEHQVGGGLTEVVRSFYQDVMAAAEAQIDAAPIELRQVPGSQKQPIWHGVIFEREAMEQEEGTSMVLDFDHGCAKRDDNGDNMCEFPHGDTIHARMQYNLARPINQGFFTVTGAPTLMGLGGFLKNKKDGSAKILNANLREVNVECPICGGVCEATLFGKKKSVPLPDCPLPAHQNITLFDMDVDLPYGDFIGLIQAKMQFNMVINRVEGDEMTRVSNHKMLVQMGRIYHGQMPKMM